MSVAIFFFATLAAVSSSVLGSLSDYKACQRKSNCTANLTPADCPPGQFLDTHFEKSCCHGCRSGIGEFDFKNNQL